MRGGQCCGSPGPRRKHRSALPKGNTGGAGCQPDQADAVPDDLAEILREGREISRLAETKLDKTGFPCRRSPSGVVVF